MHMHIHNLRSPVSLAKKHYCTHKFQKERKKEGFQKKKRKKERKKVDNTMNDQKANDVSARNDTYSCISVENYY